MKKYILAISLFMICFLSFWFLRAHHLQKLILQKVKEKDVFQFSEVRKRGFPFYVTIDLKNPQSSKFKVDGILSIGTSLFAKKAWLEVSGDLFLNEKKLKVSGTFGVLHRNLWSLIRNRHFLPALEKNPETLIKLLPSFKFYTKHLEIFRDEKRLLNLERSFAAATLQLKDSVFVPSFDVLVKGAEVESRLLEEYYFKVPMDLRVQFDMDLKLENFLPSRVDIQNLTLGDDYFRSKLKGLATLKKNQEKLTLDFKWEASQAVKRAYQPSVQKEHISRVFKNLGFNQPKSLKLPERRLFNLIQSFGHAHLQGDSLALTSWDMELKDCHLKFGHYELESHGAVSGFPLSASLMVKFINYPSIKALILNKHTSLLKPLNLLEQNSSINNNDLNLEVEYDGVVKVGGHPLEMKNLL